MVNLTDALSALGVSAYCNNNDYNTIVWTNPEETVSKEDLDAKVAEMQKAEDAIQYQRDRSYPNIGDQLDMIYWDKINGTENWKEAIDKVKADHPKPE